ncbi:MAG: hypothetical protein KBE23_00505 [Chloroflexi bacterium]|nr:hypothetical protein [Chloroflexota bacterium]MBP7041194.1 hypothetical protein [Chloroflexota bacterium]
MKTISTTPHQQIFLSDGDKKTIRATRRRPSTADGPRERAAAPQRQHDSRPPSGSSGGGGHSTGPRPRPSGSGGGQPPNLLIIGLVILLVVCGLPLMLIFGGGDDSADNSSASVANPPTAVANNFASANSTTNNEPFLPPPASTEGQTWLVMLYADADDKILEQDIYVDFNEAERVGSSDRVQIVAQLDRFKAGYRGDGDWSSARRYYITQDANLNEVNSQMVTDLGEVNMSDGRTLVDFATWAINTYPADKYVLILSDHGMGWPGGWSDPAPGKNGGSVDSSIPLASALGDELYLMELDQALGDIRRQTGVNQFELIGMDACLMSHIEVFSALAPHARYAVASQEVEPALGWAYTSFLSALASNPDMNGADLGRLIVNSYIQDDQRIVDDKARADFLGRGPTARQVAAQLEQDITLTAVDLAAMPNLLTSLNDLAYALQTANQAAVAQARTYARSFTSVFGSDIPASYIDLGNFVQVLQQETRNSDVTRTGDAVLKAIEQTIISERHGPKRQGATGISIYFPNSQLYRNPVSGPQSYTAVARRFAEASLWDDYLAYHYTGRAFSATAVELAVPDRSTPVIAPGAAAIQLSPITLSGDVAAPGQPVLLSAEVSGDNIGYIYFWTGFYDQAANAIFVADTDYLQSSDTREVDGVYYPDWGSDPFTLEFEWEPLMFAISDGQNSVLGALAPQSYGAAPEDATYTVDGLYTYADGGETRYARLFFRDGVLQQVFGFTGQDSTGAPREIMPQPGDRFTLQEKWLDLDASGNVVNTSTQEGGTLTFGSEKFTWEELDAAAGEYVVGFIVEDLDGAANEVYAHVTVR